MKQLGNFEKVFVSRETMEKCLKFKVAKLPKVKKPDIILIILGILAHFSTL